MYYYHYRHACFNEKRICKRPVYSSLSSRMLDFSRIETFKQPKYRRNENKADDAVLQIYRENSDVSPAQFGNVICFVP